MIRAIIFIIVVIIVTVLSALAVIIVSIFNRYSFLIYKNIIRLWSRVLLSTANVKIDVTGIENIEQEKSYVVVSNHQSHLDIPVMIYKLPLRLTFLAKKELFKIPIFGWGMQAAGVLRIDRSDQQKAIQTLKKAEKIILDRKFSVMAFPEGTRSADGNIQRFKKGSFVLAINTGLPILPVSVNGTHSILPKKKIMIKPGRVRLRIHPPIDTENYNFNARNQLVETVHQTIAKDLNEN